MLADTTNVGLLHPGFWALERLEVKSAVVAGVLGARDETMRALCCRGLVLLMSLFGVLSVAAPVAAQGSRTSDSGQEARRLFESGIELFDAGKHERALDMFQRSYALRESPTVLYNIAVTERELGRSAAAAGHFREYLDTAELAPGERTRVAGELESLREELATVATDIVPEGATIEVDGDVVGNAPLERSLLLEPGHHRIRVWAPGYEARSEAITVSAGAETTVGAELVRNDAAGGSAHSVLAGVGWGSIGLSGALFVGTFTAWRVRESNAQDWNQCVKQGMAEGCFGKRSKARHAERWSIGLLVGSLSLAVAGSTLLLLMDVEPPDESAAIQCGVGPADVGAACSLRF